VLWADGEAAAWQRYNWWLSDDDKQSILALPGVDLSLYVKLGSPSVINTGSAC